MTLPFTPPQPPRARSYSIVAGSVGEQEVNGNVVRVGHMGNTRVLLDVWDRVRQGILAGRVTTLPAGLLEDSQDSVRAALRASKAMMHDDPPPSRFGS